MRKNYENNFCSLIIAGKVKSHSLEYTEAANRSSCRSSDKTFDAKSLFCCKLNIDVERGEGARK